MKKNFHPALIMPNDAKNEAPLQFALQAEWAHGRHGWCSVQVDRLPARLVSQIVPWSLFSGRKQLPFL